MLFYILVCFLLMFFLSFEKLIFIPKKGRYAHGGVAAALGKQELLFICFSDRENTGKFIVQQGKFLRHMEDIFNCVVINVTFK